jgi:glycosyltransferase involved in cell wall biosynthesis
MAIHNEERFLRPAIASVLQQTFPDFELLVIDDASTDRSPAIARSFGDPRVRVLRNERQRGLTASLNFGLTMTRSAYVARLDGNDIAFPNRLARQVAWLDAHPDVGALGGQAITINARGWRIRRVHLNPLWYRPVGGAELQWYRMFDTPFIHSAVMFRRELAERLGGYDERQPLYQDADLWMRMGRVAGLANLDDSLVAYRFLRHSMTADLSRRERRRYAELKAPVVHAVMRDILQWNEVPERWAWLWAQTTDPTTSSIDGPATMEILDRCASRFFEIHPEARGNRRIARHRVSMAARILLKSEGRSTARLFLLMLRWSAGATIMLLPSLIKTLLIRRAFRSPAGRGRAGLDQRREPFLSARFNDPEAG